MTWLYSRAMETYPCSLCFGEFLAPFEALLLNHVRITHSCDPDFSIQCSSNACCLRTFKNFRTYQNHLLTHRGHHTESGVVSMGNGHFSSSNAAANAEDSGSSDTMHYPTSTDMESFAARWILKTRESRCLTRSAMQGVIEDTEDLVGFVVQTLRQQTHAVLRANDLNPTSICGLTDVFDGPATKPFDGLASFHQHLQYCRKKFNLIVSDICYSAGSCTGVYVYIEMHHLCIRNLGGLS